MRHESREPDPPGPRSAPSPGRTASLSGPARPPRVRLVVLNYNGGDNVIRSVAALTDLDWPADRLEVVVIDNASTDGSIEEVEERFPGARVIRNTTNTGFPANNLALRDLEGIDYVGLVNPDAFVEPGWLAPLVEVLDADPEVGAACGRMLFADRPGPSDDRRERPEVVTDVGKDVVSQAGNDIVNNVGNLVFDDGYSADRGFGEPDEGQYDDPEEVFAWTGGNVLLRPEYLRDVGLFDERFFLYYEDTDLSWRGQSRGWRYLYAPDALVRHVHAASTVEGSALFQHHVERNRLLMLAKNAPAPMVSRAVWRFLLATLSYARRDIVKPLLARRRLSGQQVRRRLGSFLGFLWLLPVMWRQRRRIRRRATISDDEILARLTPAEKRR